MVHIPQVITSPLCASLLPGIGDTAAEETSIVVPAPGQKAGRLNSGRDGAVGRRGRDRDRRGCVGKQEVHFKLAVTGSRLVSCPAHTPDQPARGEGNTATSDASLL